MIILVTGENIFTSNIKKVALTNNNIDELITYKALDGFLSYKLPDSWDVEEKKYPGNYIIYDNNFISDSMGLWGYVQIINSEGTLEEFIEKEEKNIEEDEILNYEILDEKIEDNLVKKVTYKEKNDRGAIYFNTIYYKELDDNKIVKVLFSAREGKEKEDYSVVYKSIIHSIEENK